MHLSPLNSLSFDKPQDVIEKIIYNVEKVILGKRSIIEKAVAAFLCGGHILLEDVPGVGKTMLVRSLAATVGITFKRIQCTPDLLPSDVSGVSIYNQKTGEFEFHPGPIMSNIVLADEMNRTSPKTQAALLEAMEEKRVTIDGTGHALPEPFFLLATQNPIEFEGTFTLPEAQLDRFLMKIELGYPDPVHEVEMLERLQEKHPIDNLRPVLLKEELLQLQKLVRTVHVDESLKQYIVSLTAATRTHADIYLGASPRASFALMRVAQAKAFMQGRGYVIPDDIKEMVLSTLLHRLLLKSDARFSGKNAQSILSHIVEKIPVPTLRHNSAKAALS